MANKSSNKQSVVLLISIMFIALISALIIKNLDDSNRFIKEISNSQALPQTALSIENLNKELLPFLSDNKESIEDIQSFFGISQLKYGNVKVNINIQNYQGMYDLILIKNAKTLYYKDLEEQISNEYDFLSILKSHPDIKSKKQLDAFIDEYAKKAGDENIKSIKDSFTFFETKIDKTDMAIYKITYELDIGGKKTTVKMLYNIDTRKIEDFELN